MGQWKGSTLKEYICKELHTFSEGMSCNMKWNSKYVNILGSAFHDVTDTVVATAHNLNTPAN